MIRQEDAPIDSKSSGQKFPSYSQLNLISDSSLSSIRDQIKKVMIPLLIKIFQLKLELSQSICSPSRLQPKSQDSPEQITDQLKRLDEDLKLLSMWCESARNQIAKALSVPEEEQKEQSATCSSPTPNPSVAKSFSDALSSQVYPPKQKEATLPQPTQETVAKAPIKQKSWWKQFFS